MYDILAQLNLKWVDHFNWLEDRKLPQEILYSQFRERLRKIDHPQKKSKKSWTSIQTTDNTYPKIEKKKRRKKSVGYYRRIRWTTNSCRCNIHTFQFIFSGGMPRIWPQYNVLIYFQQILYNNVAFQYVHHYFTDLPTVKKCFSLRV